MNERPSIGVGVILVYGDKVLMSRRRGAHGNDMWSFLGGHLERGESFEDCARREALEEAGVEICNPTIVGVTNDIFTAEDKHCVTIFVIARAASDTFIDNEPEYQADWHWREHDKLPEPLFLPVRNLLDQGFRIADYLQKI